MRHALRFQSTWLGLSLLLYALPAGATKPTKLVYSRTEAAQSCPSEAVVRGRVAERLGYDPFRSEAPSQVWVAIDQTPNGFAARMELSAQRESQGVRELSVAGPCLELIEVVVLSLSIAIDPERANAFVAAEPTKPAEPTPATPAEPTTSEASVEKEQQTQRPATPEPAVAPKTPAELDVKATSLSSDGVGRHERSSAGLPLELAAGILPEFSFGVVPAPSLGGSLLVRLRRGAFSLAVAARSTILASHEVNDGETIRARSTGATLSPCWHHSLWQGCALLLVARFNASSAYGRDTRYYASPGLRLGLQWPERSRWALLAQAEALLQVTSVTVVLDQNPVWSAPWLSSTLGAGALVRF